MDQVKKISKYEALQLELEMTRNNLNHTNMPYELYRHLKEKEALLLAKIDECPLIYEIWYDSYDGSMRMDNGKCSIFERYMNKDKAHARLKELNDGCNYGRPYFMRIRELDG